MSGSPTQDARGEQSAEQRRKKRRERAAKNHAPEPKDIVSGAGQPLDAGVRRELEEQLGHDFSRVRLHTDRDAGALTELLGADAVAVGQDIFFGEGAYRPGTTDGQRLLAHELLHTVQNPEGLGALRAGRELGAVSLPQQAAEREAESAAQDLVRSTEPAGPEQLPQVEEGQATPGWMRYATVDADRNRIEQIDPATLVDRLTNSVVRSLRGDPEDRSKRTRMQLAKMPDELLDGVLVNLENRLLSSEHDRVLDLVDDVTYVDELEQNSLDAPGEETDAAADVHAERESEARRAEEKQDEEELPEVAPGPEKSRIDREQVRGSTPENGGSREKGTTPQGRQPQRKPDGGSQEAKSPAGSGSSRGEGGSAEPGVAARQESSGGAEEAEKKETGGAEGKDGQDQQGAPAASKEESAAANRPGAADAATAGKQTKPEDKGGKEGGKGGGKEAGKEAGKDKPVASPKASAADPQLSGAVSRLDGVRGQDLAGEEEQAAEDPFDEDSASEVEVGGAEQSAWDTKLQPEDFLPEQDLDVSGVPTADTSEPGAAGSAALPSFAAPPPTKAEKVQAERDAEDAEDADLLGPDESSTADAEAEPATETDQEEPTDGQLSAVDVERAAAPPPGADAAAKDPKSGDDPKAGPVAAQTTVQEAPGGAGGETKEAPAKEAAAKEEKGAPAAGDKAGAAPQKESQQAAGGKSAASEPGAGAAGAEHGDKSAQSAGGSGAGTAAAAASETSVAPGASGRSGSGTESKASGGGGGGGAQAEAPAAKAAPYPAAAAPAKAPEAPAAPAADPGPAPVPEEAPAPRAASRKQGAAPKAAQGGGGGGGGGGSKAAAPGKGKKDSAPAPNLATVSPEAGLSTASKLKPHKALQAMSGVGSAADRTVGDEHKALAAAPPQMQRPAGAPRTLEGKPKADAPATYSQDPAQKSEAPKDEKAEVKGAKEPEGQIEAEKAEEPGGWDTFKMALGFGIGKVLSWVGFKVDAQELAAKFAGLPTKDEALKKAQAGNAPGVQMQGAAEDTAGEQGASVDAKGQEAVSTGRDDAGRPMGEDQVYPDAPKEQMKGKVPGAGGGKGGIPEGGAATGAVPPKAASEVAEHDRGPQFQRAFTDGQKGMSDSRQTKDKEFRESQAKHKAKVDAEIATNTKNQTDERGRAMTEVTAQRADWRTEQDGELKKLGTKKTDRHEKVRKDVKDREEKTDKDVTKEKDDGDKKIKDENDKAEKDAEKKRDDSVNDSGNWVSKAFNWLKEKVIEIKNAIVRVIRAARDAVIGFIKHFKETVERWIDEARKFIVDTIKQLITDLIEFAKAMVRAVIELANRIRKLITNLIAAAIALVNRLATMLKKIVTDLLNAIAKLLSDILNILKKMLMDVIKAVVDAVKTVLDYASKLLGALGEFMLIAVDFLSDPGGWLSGAKNSAVDGANNHLFREVVNAVKTWFQSKIEEIIGVPKAIIEKLIKGGFSLAKIVKETWDAVVPMLPLIIGEIVITKVIAKLIPGAGWAMAVIDAIRTAIGALGAILQAIGAVISWLKVVRQGGAGILFAKAVAAGVVVLLELAYQALMDGIGKYVAKVGKRLKGVAARLGKKLPGGKGDGKRPAGGADDKGAGKGDGKSDDKGAPKAEPASSTAAPRPGTKPASKPDARPGTKPGTKSAEDKPGTQGPGKKDGPDGKKPTDKNDDKAAPGKPDTSPTPAAKPKPKPEPPAKPKPDVEPKPKPKDDAPGKPRDDKPKEKDSAGKPKDDATGKPKDDKDTSNKPKGKDSAGKPKDQDSNKPKGKEKDKDKDKPKGKDKCGKSKNDKNRNRKGDERKSKPSPKQEKRDKRKEEEDKGKENRLRKILARIRPRDQKLLDKGLAESDHVSTLAEFKNYYGLTGLYKTGDKSFGVRGTLNPAGMSGIHGVNTPANQDRTRPEEFPLPEVSPASAVNDNLTRVDYDKVQNTGSNISSKHMEGKFLDSTMKGKGQVPDKDRKQPLGWEYIANNGLGKGAEWVKMHLLPGGSSKGLGGHNGANNLVPARGHRTNDLFHREIEKWAHDSIIAKTEQEHGSGKSAKHRMIWYKAEADFNHSDFPGFPDRISASYGGYRKKRSGLSGKSPADWEPTTSHTYPATGIPQPDPNEKHSIHINSAGEKILGDRLKISARSARYISGSFAYPDTIVKKPVYKNLGTIRKYLREQQRVNKKPSDKIFDEIMRKLAKKNQEIDWRV